MQTFCEDLKNNVSEIVRTWEELLEKQPWFLHPKDRRNDGLPDVVLELVNAALCEPANEEAHRRNVIAAAELGWLRRESDLPEHLMFTEFHVLRQAIWYYLDRKHGPSEQVSQAIFRIDAAITLAINASLWGYHRAEIEALGKWDDGIHRIVQSSPFLQRSRRNAQPIERTDSASDPDRQPRSSAPRPDLTEQPEGPPAAGSTITHAVKRTDLLLDAEGPNGLSGSGDE